LTAYNSFLELLEMLQPKNFDSNDNIFLRWRERNDDLRKKKTRVSPIELLLLGSLHYLGRGWTFDNLEESTFIAKDVHPSFLTSLWNSVQSTYIPSLWLLHPHCRN
jgi:hypothetical protein